jgi:DNA-binding CsgD family transcriptional regulator
MARKDALTAAENEVLACAAAGLSNAEIARRRGKSLRTIANQLASAYRKLGVSGRQEVLAQLNHGCGAAR